MRITVPAEQMSDIRYKYELLYPVNLIVTWPPETERCDLAICFIERNDETTKVFSHRPAGNLVVDELTLQLGLGEYSLLVCTDSNADLTGAASVYYLQERCIVDEQGTAVRVSLDHGGVLKGVLQSEPGHSLPRVIRGCAAAACGCGPGDFFLEASVASSGRFRFLGLPPRTQFHIEGYGVFKVPGPNETSEVHAVD